MAVNPNPMQRMAVSATERSIEDTERITHWFQRLIRTESALRSTTVVNHRFWEVFAASVPESSSAAARLASGLCSSCWRTRPERRVDLLHIEGDCGSGRHGAAGGSDDDLIVAGGCALRLVARSTAAADRCEGAAEAESEQDNKAHRTPATAGQESDKKQSRKRDARRQQHCARPTLRAVGFQLRINICSLRGSCSGGGDRQRCRKRCAGGDLSGCGIKGAGWRIRGGAW